LDLHCDFACSEIKGDLLVEHARNNQAHDFALARGQLVVAFSQLGEVTPLLASYTVAIQSLANRIQQVLILERLGKKLHGTGFHGFHRHRNIPMAGDEDDGNLYAGLSQLALQVDTVESWKTHVYDHAAWNCRGFVALNLFRYALGCVQ